MRRRLPWERWWTVSLLASLLVHLLFFWGLDHWLSLDATERGFKAQLQPLEREPFKVKRRLALPPGKHAFTGRPSFSTSPRTLQGLTPGINGDYLERGIPEGMAAQAPTSELYSSYQGTDTLFTHPEWERLALRVWRDSLLLALRNQAEWEGPQPLNPFEVETLARGQGRSVVILDSTGQLARAYCFLPIYGIYVPRLNKTSVGGRSVRNTYADLFHALERSLQELSQNTSLHIELDAHYQVEVDSTASVIPDPIHRWGEFSHRAVLTLEQTSQYPFLSLQYIDVESTQSLALYVLAGGFSLMDQKQLDRLEAELNTHAELQVRRIEVDSGHPLMKAYYPLAGYHIQGLEVNGRLAAIAPLGSGQSPFLINAVVYALMQPSNLAERLVEK